MEVLDVFGDGWQTVDLKLLCPSEFDVLAVVYEAHYDSLGFVIVSPGRVVVYK